MFRLLVGVLILDELILGALMLAASPDTEEQRRRNAEMVSRLRKKRIAEGRTYVHLDLPAELVERCDALKEQRRLAGRAPIIEEALKEYFAKHGA